MITPSINRINIICCIKSKELIINKSIDFFITGEMGCSDEISTILSMFQVQNILIRPSSGQASIRARIAHRKFEVEEGDLITMLNIYTAYEKIKSASWCQKYFLNFKGLKRATEIRSKMRIMMKNLNIPLRSSNGNVNLIILFFYRVFKDN